MDIVKKIILKTILVILFFLVLGLNTVEVLAQDANKKKNFLPVECSPERAIYKPTETLILIYLDQDLYKLPGSDAEEIAKAIFYEFTYIRENKSSPFNAILVDGKLEYTSCNFIDSTVNIAGVDEGAFILGTYGQVSMPKVQEIVDMYKIKNVMEATLVSSDNTKNTVVALANIKKCNEGCKKLTLVKEGLKAREYEIEVDNPNYATSVRQQEQLSFSIKVKNNSLYPLYAEGSNILVISPTKKGLSNLYHSSWPSTNRVATLSGPLLPGAETILTATLGSPLLPGKYSETLQFKVGNKKISKPFAVKFTVEKDNLKLAKIVPKGGAPFANIRQTPSLRGNLVGKVDAGEYVIVRGYKGAWVKIELKEGKVAWVYKPFVREL